MRGKFLKNFTKCFALFVAMLMYCTSCYSFALAADPLNKYKAAFLINFVKYMQNSTSNSAICIVSDAELYGLLKNKPNTKLIDGSDVAGCALVYVNKSDSSTINNVLKSTAGKQIITVSNSTNFLSKGGLIEVYEDGGRLKFALNIKKATSLKFKINSKLVEIADKTQ